MRICTVFLMGLSQAAAVMIGQTVGRGETQRAQLQGRTFYLLSIAGGIAGGIIIWAASPVIVDFYGLSAASRAVTMEMMLAMCLLMIFQSIQSIMSKGVLRGGGDTRFLVFADLIFLWTLNIPLGFLGGLVFKVRPFWVFVLLKLDAVCKTFLCLWRMLKCKWINNEAQLTNV